MSNDTTTYDPLNCECINKFKTAINQTQCLFAKNSVSWGSYDWNDTQSLEENVKNSIPMLKIFTQENEKEKTKDFKPPDNFIFEVRGTHYSDTMDHFCETVYQVLKVLSDNDPKGFRAMDSPKVGQVYNGWNFHWNNLNMFLVTFAPFYDETSPRYQFGIKDSCFILLQGEHTFGRVKLGGFGEGGMRDLIKNNFASHNRPFNTALLPLVIKPRNEFTDEPIPQWCPKHS